MGAVCCTGAAVFQPVKTKHDSTVDHHIVSTAKNPNHPHYQGDRRSFMGLNLNQTNDHPSDTTRLPSGGPVISSGKTEVEKFYYDAKGVPQRSFETRVPSGSAGRNLQPGEHMKASQMRRGSLPANAHKNIDVFERLPSDPTRGALHSKSREGGKSTKRRMSCSDVGSLEYDWEGGRISIPADAGWKPVKGTHAP